MLNRMYLNSSNKNNIGSYFKLSYSFKNEQRDNIEYPLDGSLAEITLSKNFGIESNINNSEINLKLELHKNIYDKLFIGSSLKLKLAVIITLHTFTHYQSGLTIILDLMSITLSQEMNI